MYLFPKVEFLTYIPKVSPMSRVRPLNSQLQMLISAALGWELDTLNPFWSIKGPKGSPRKNHNGHNQDRQSKNKGPKEQHTRHPQYTRTYNSRY